jgi:ferrous-iron efflux pump FieF
MNAISAKDTRQARLMRMATYASVTVAFTLIGIKIFAYVLTGSVALLSSLIDSVLDAFASVINLLAVRHSLMPADREHRFGHGKAEPLAGLGQAAFISGSSVFLVFEAINHLIHPRPVEHGMTGIVVIFISLLLTIMLVIYQKYVVSRTKSIAIHADSIHYLSDIGLNLSVIIALVLSAYMDLPLADPIIAIGIAAYIIHSAWTILINAYNQLMDKELPDADREKIVDIALGHPCVSDLHELRTRTAGQDVFIQLHLEIDGSISLLNAHRIADEVERSLRAAYPNADILIHQDPAGLEEIPAEPD